ncbi:phosphate acetyltransferase [Desulfosediminicola flagellatus]|uniref:phosphate acetyltransferase n=1 Tax=Desulfosediminicola flagellatus TaxID=2569541 RepID=UPI0010AC48A4|nr:phosphate acetyltransferase [Desulfosediminicola flagellatus]
MSTNLYIMATEERSGKSAIVLGVMQMLLKSIDKVAFFRPVIHETEPGWEDPVISLILEHFDIDINYEDTYGLTLQEAQELVNSGQETLLHDIILNKYNALKAEFDFILCDGTDFRGKDIAFESNINTDIAANLGAPVLLVSSGRKKETEELVRLTQLSIDALIEEGVDVIACVVNRAAEGVVADDFGRIQTKATGDNRLPVYVIPENHELANPTVGDVKRWLGARTMYGEEGMTTLVENYVVAAMQIGNYLDYIKPGSMIITPGDRCDIILSTISSRLSTTYPDISGIILTGNLLPSENVLRLLQGLSTTVPVPILAVEGHTYQTIEKVGELYGYIEAHDTKRIATAIGEFTKHVDLKELGRRVVSTRPTRVTPKMFEFALMEKAGRNLQRIVLPEGTCDRILQAADILMRRGVANLVLLGDEEEVRMRATGCGLDLKWVEIIDPSKSSLLDSFVAEYMELRKHKGVIEEVARDRMSDPTYFGTMMVHKGLADGMVSGAENTTAHTIRPAFEFIKTKPGISVVSSVFIMCLKDRVLVYGDCAVNPNPNARQLAEIALSSAATARIFGVEPRVAMLSYSTGSSGKGEDVERIVEATAIARELILERGMDLPLEGPLQYDAAIDPDVAATKLPGSLVAGKATVFTFPDLNTGNNTYKAVQRSANAVAIGPILQGLNKPVNDLSRGCTVDDIVNTVAITAIQAQAEKEEKK